MNDFYPQEYDCENSTCPNCGDNCLDYAEELCTETKEAYIHVYRCSVCNYIGTWHELKADDFESILPPYEA